MMISNKNEDYDRDNSFNCSFYLDHGIELPYNNVGYYQRQHRRRMMAYNDGFVNYAAEKDYNFSAAKLKQFQLTKASRQSLIEDYYPIDDSNLLSCITQSDLEDFTWTGNKFHPINDISAVEDAMLPPCSPPYDETGFKTTEDLMYRLGKYRLQQLSAWNQKAKKLLEDAECYAEERIDWSAHQSSPSFETITENYLKGFGESRNKNCNPCDSEPPEDNSRKRRLCRHFLKGHCKRGKACDFLHDLSIFCPNSQKVFLGGLPTHITEITLRQKLAEQGYKVINKPNVLRGFTPQVCLASVEEAQKLIKKKSILIDGSPVDVRAYEAFAKVDIDKIRPAEVKRSVFLGGLSRGTTSHMIQDDLDKMDVKVVNHPLIKTGFSPKVTLATVEESNMLIKLKKVRINNTLVDVRPYINYKDSVRSTKKH
jgi:hypothetical protein